MELKYTMVFLFGVKTKPIKLSELKILHWRIAWHNYYCGLTSTWSKPPDSVVIATGLWLLIRKEEIGCDQYYQANQLGKGITLEIIKRTEKEEFEFEFEKGSSPPTSGIGCLSICNRSKAGTEGGGSLGCIIRAHRSESVTAAGSKTPMIC